MANLGTRLLSVRIRVIYPLAHLAEQVVLISFAWFPGRWHLLKLGPAPVLNVNR